MSQYTPEAVEAMADNLAGYLNTPAAPMLRAYAATLRQAARVDEGEVQRALDSWYDIEGGIHGDELRERMRAALEAALSAQPLIHESGAMSSESGQPAERQGEAVAFLVTDAKGKKFTIYNALLAEAIRKIAKDKGSSLQIDAVCTIPDYGWFCTRGEGHEGPCAAWPNSPTETCPTCGGPATRREVSGAFEMRDEWSHTHPAAPVGVPDGAVDTRDHFGPPCVAVVFDTQENANKYRDKLTEAMQLRQNLAAATPAPQGVDRG